MMQVEKRMPCISSQVPFCHLFSHVHKALQERNSSDGSAPLRLLERSVFTDRMVFVRAVHEARWMTDMEICIYDSWFDPVVSALPGLVPDAFVYLRADPEICLRYVTAMMVCLGHLFLFFSFLFFWSAQGLGLHILFSLPHWSFFSLFSQSFIEAIPKRGERSHTRILAGAAR